MKINYLLLFLILFPFAVNCQIRITGHITNDNNQIYPNVTVTLCSLNSTTIMVYDYPDDKGVYSLIYDGKSDSLIISVTGFNIVKQSKIVFRKNQTLDFKIIEKEMELKEVIVKSKKIWGEKDTVNYLVSSYKTEKDQVIGDVLRKMPGILIKESGEISYNGKPISNFYIENLDLLQGRYGIATNNIQATDVATVQVLENHQSIKAKNDIISNNVAINLKLKEGAKGTFSLIGQLGIGQKSLLYENEIIGLYFAKKYQNISVYKGNNTGNNIINDLIGFSENRIITEDKLLELKMPNYPPLRQKRYLFNNTNTISINQLLKTSDDKQINLSLNYINDFEKKKAFSSTSYFLSNDSMYAVSENASSMQNTNLINLELLFNKNTKDIYLSNSFQIECERQFASSQIINQLQTVNNELKLEDINIKNEIHYIKTKSNKRTFNFHSFNQYKSSPQKLSFNPYTLPLFLSDCIFSIDQYAKTLEFYSINTCKLHAFNIGSIKFSIDGKFEVEHKELKTNITQIFNSNSPIEVSAERLKNNPTSLKIKSGIYPFASYLHSSVKLYFGFPTYIQYLDVQNAFVKSTKRLIIQPFLNLNIKSGFSSQIDLNYNYNNRFGSISDNSTAYYFNNYLTLNLNNGILTETQEHHLNLSWRYKDIMKMFFCVVEGNYNRNNKNNLLDISIENELIFNSLKTHENNQEFANLSGQLSKGFDFLNSAISLKAIYSIINAEQSSQNIINKYRNTNLNFELNTNVVFSKRINIEANSTWQKSQMLVNMIKTYQPINTINNNVNIFYNFTKNFYLSSVAEHYYFDSKNNSPKNNNIFFDAMLNFNLKSTAISLTLSNIFNNKQYIFSTFSGLNSYYYNYQIRPINILIKIKFKII